MSPDKENAVMSQQDIDAMVSSSSDIGGEAPVPARPQEAQPTADAADASVSEAGVAASDAGGSASADVAQRLAELEAGVARISQKGGGSDQVEANIQALAQQLQALSSRVEEILQHLPNTVGYGVRETFQCSTCNAQGLVAGRVICTQCGTDTFVGWWPQT